MIRRRLVITGQVQNVWYRAWFIEQARGLDLRGWVRNRTDGSVEAVVEGAPDAVDAIVDAAHRGPPAARVDDVAIGVLAPDEILDGFEKRPTV